MFSVALNGGGHGLDGSYVAADYVNLPVLVNDCVDGVFAG